MEINSVFKSYYSSLYTSESPDNSDVMVEFLDNLEIPTIESTLAEQIDAPVTLDEIIRSIKSLQSGKAPGPHGFPLNFTKSFMINWPHYYCLCLRSR